MKADNYQQYDGDKLPDSNVVSLRYAVEITMIYGDAKFDILTVSNLQSVETRLQFHLFNFVPRFDPNMHGVFPSRV